jgi:hypothetical protein
MLLHRRDMTGDDATAVHSLMQPWMTEHSVHDVGTPLLARGATGLDLGPTGRIETHLPLLTWRSMSSATSLGCSSTR